MLLVLQGHGKTPGNIIAAGVFVFVVFVAIVVVALDGLLDVVVVVVVYFVFVVVNFVVCST